MARNCARNFGICTDFFGRIQMDTFGEKDQQVRLIDPSSRVVYRLYIYNPFKNSDSDFSNVSASTSRFRRQTSFFPRSRYDR